MRIPESISSVWDRSGKALRSSFSAAASFFRSDGRAELRRSMLSTVKVLLSEGGIIPPSAEKTYRRLQEEFDPEGNGNEMWKELLAAPEITAAQSGAALAQLPEEERQVSCKFFLTLMLSLDEGERKESFLKEAVLASGLSGELYEIFRQEIGENLTRHRQIIRSGAGVIAAIVVLAVFILTATLLRSVIFGLIAAYLLLPVEKYYERTLRRKSGFGYWLWLPGQMLFYIPRQLASFLKRRSDTAESAEVRKHKKEQKIIARAVGQTVITFFLAVLLFAGGVIALSSRYLSGVGQSLHRWQTEQKANPDSGENAFIAKVRTYAEKSPFTRYLLNQTEAALQSEQSRQQLLTMLFRRTGGVLSFLFGVAGSFGTLLFDLLLTLFFGLLFLMKLAEFSQSGEHSARSDFAVRTILNSKWLPNASEEVLADARRIVGGVFLRLRTWVKGYLSLMVIDSTVYTAVFGCLGVPYFPLLGIAAGCGILLPYIGPIASCCLTLLVTWLAGDGSLVQLGLVLGAYLIYSGVIEQFILYPIVIGESLGLTTLETIIVVLLGAIFAGIAGMILALPAASVLKYLIPQIYRCWGNSRKEQRS